MPPEVASSHISAPSSGQGSDPAYLPASALHLVGEDGPARMRFHLDLAIEGHSLCDGELRAALVEHLGRRFNVSHIAVEDVIKADLGRVLLVCEQRAEEAVAAAQRRRRRQRWCSAAEEAAALELLRNPGLGHEGVDDAEH